MSFIFCSQYINTSSDRKQVESDVHDVALPLISMVSMIVIVMKIGRGSFTYFFCYSPPTSK